ncbi:LysR family transcriptional regulator [Pseudomonas benzenivorans]|uniref:LysR family transcriptional regulator n=1 Tax=Pseudomonas benzenivorans TaxID=556533 RepID=A0ABY5H2N6_9PSED|nr:LysR substrate-binding domain-containing protein [Pseudomonas benzenivorans]UTW05898.1 LysR family transcriptional regulator [Pseudomonas benzenivorans]
MNWTRRLRLHHLNLLTILSETGSLSEAARVAHTTQPGLSKWLKELEEDVGATLFERHARGLKPTAEGQLLLNHARRILSEMERAQHNLAALQEFGAPQVALGTSPAAAPSLVPDAVMAFLRRHPRGRVELQENTMNTLLEKLEQGELDVVVGRLDNYQPRTSLHSEMLQREPMRIVARPGHCLANRKQLQWQDLQAQDWVLWPQGTPIRSRLDAALSSAGLKPLSCRVESTSLMANLWLLQSSNMLSAVSGRVAEHFTGRGLVKILDFELDGEGMLGMCWRDEPHQDPVVDDLLESLREAARLPATGVPQANSDTAGNEDSPSDSLTT